jgi:putative ABC transport system permease protein
MRTLLSVLLIGVPVTLILSLVGLSHGMIEDAQRRTRAIGADIIVRPPGSTFLTLSGAIPQKLIDDFFEKQPHVALVVGVVNQPVQGVTLGATGVDLKKFEQMSGGFEFLEGGPFRGPRDVMVDEWYASENRLRAGSTIRILNQDWRVSGIFQNGKLARIVFPLPVLQELTNNANPPKVTQIYLKLDDPKNTDAVIKNLRAKLGDNFPIQSVQEFTSLFSVSNIPGLKQFVWVIISIGVVIGFAVVCLSMYMAVLQRTREIGILKSLGGSQLFIVRIILAEALIMGFFGTVLGIIMSIGAWWLIRTLIPASIQMVIVPSWWPIALLVTLVGTGLGALYPGLTAARQDPIEALAYE